MPPDELSDSSSSPGQDSVLVDSASMVQAIKESTAVDASGRNLPHSSNSASDQPPTASAMLSPSGRYILQVGAYRNRKSADEAANDLRLMGYPAQVIVVESMFRVRIGFFERVTDAKTMGKLLHSKMGIQYWVDNR